MKKLLRIFLSVTALFFICTCAIAAVTINHIVSPDGMVSFNIHSRVPSNNYIVIGMPISIGLERLNEFLAGISTTENAYLEFGYFDIQNQNTWWFPETCKIILDKTENINVVMTEMSCEVT